MKFSNDVVINDIDGRTELRCCKNTATICLTKRNEAGKIDHQRMMSFDSLSEIDLKFKENGVCEIALKTSNGREDIRLTINNAKQIVAFQAILQGDDLKEAFEKMEQQ